MRIGDLSDSNLIGKIRLMKIDFSNPFPDVWKTIYWSNINSHVKTYYIFGVKILIIHR